MDVTIVNRSPVRVVCLRHVGPYGPAVAAFWQQQFTPYVQRHGLAGRPVYGISHDDPARTPPAQCRFDVCTEVDEHFVATAPGQVTTTPGGRYAVLPFKGTPQTIQAAWAYLLRDWLSASGWRLDARPTFEVYLPGTAVDEDTGAFECQIVIPLAPL
jgi:AraC family transcriptional regulator